MIHYRKPTLFKLSFPVVVLVFLLTSCKKHKDSTPVPESSSSLFNSYDRKTMLSHLGNNIIIPSFSRFYSYSDSLSVQCHAFANNPNKDNLQLVQEYWTKTIASWEQCELYNIGIVSSQLLEAPVNSWPTDTVKIYNAVTTTQTINDAFITTQSDFAIGLPAIEFLIFYKGDTSVVINAFKNSSKRGAYLSALSDNLKASAGAIYNSWIPTGGNYIKTFIAADGNDVNSSIGLLVNQMIYYTDDIKNTKISIPLGLSGNSSSQPPSELIESYYSVNTLPNISNNLIAIEDIFLGKDSTGFNGNGFDDLLNYMNAKYNGGSLADSVEQRIKIAEQKIKLITPTLSDGNLNDVLAANTALQNLLVIMKIDMKNSLGIVITYTDNDGD
jgi:predicted lipoprotein